MPDKRRCQATVFKRDTYRYTGRGKHGFEMHYSKQQCKRRAKDNGYCWQHHYFAPSPAGTGRNGPHKQERA